MFEWPDGDKYQGMWKNGGRYGAGKLILKSGVAYNQTWNEKSHANYAESVPSKFPDAL